MPNALRRLFARLFSVMLLSMGAGHFWSIIVVVSVPDMFIGCSRVMFIVCSCVVLSRISFAIAGMRARCGAVQCGAVQLLSWSVSGWFAIVGGAEKDASGDDFAGVVGCTTCSLWFSTSEVLFGPQ